MNVKAETIRVDDKKVACDGGGGQLGHPRVYLAIDDDQKATCPYCGQLFIYQPEGGSTSH